MPCTHIELRKAKGNDFACIENLMQFYNYELSEWLSVKFESNGLFTIRSKAEYWKKSRTQAFLIFVADELAGFVTLDDETYGADADFNIGYFFVSRRFRGRGVGRAVVEKLLNLYPGNWEIFYITANLAAGKFWDAVLPALTHNSFSRQSISVDDHDCTLFKFTSSSPAGDAVVPT
jgi:predicted acetyltransferase